MNAKDCAMDAPREPAILQMMQQHGGHNPPRKVLQAKAATDSSGLLNLCGEDVPVVPPEPGPAVSHPAGVRP